jgi:hypothetical protein
VDCVIRSPGVMPQAREFDGTQHFNRYRAATLRRYPLDVALRFPRDRWIEVSMRKARLESGRWGRAAPPFFPGEGGRHLQRAFRDALADILPQLQGFGPTMRIADFEVTPWVWKQDVASGLADLLGERLSTG